MDTLEYRVWARQDKPRHPWIKVAAFLRELDALEYRAREETDPYKQRAAWHLLVTRTDADPNTFNQYGHTAAWLLDTHPDRATWAEDTPDD